MNVFVDTNILRNEKFSPKDYPKVYTCIVSIEELDHQKSNEINGYQAREAIRKIKDATNIEIRTNYSFSGVVNKFLEHGNDNHILAFAAEVCSLDGDCKFLTDDYNLLLKAQALNIPCQLFEFKKDQTKKYTGIREVFITEEEYLVLRDSLDINPYALYPNEYIIINNTTTKDQYLYMWNGRFLEEAKTKPISNKYINKINHLDIYQKAFIHMLQNDNAKIKITDSIYGAGKSFLMIHWALQMLDRDKFNKMIFVKSDSPPKGRREFPALPGNVNEKCEPLMGVLTDTTSEDNLTDILLRNNKLEILPIQFAKGRSLKKTILFINEAQDFTPSEMERLLSRLGEDSVALIDGSTQQIDNRYCYSRNGLTVVSNNFKDKPNAAQVNMVEDYRSEISKMVSEMDWHD